ncbi:zinc finger protein 436 [Phalacrocorax carbo]|uniref:zinc finger protein 436 n=1 Tax=Phalacrocorax carbo TaxID=9209 RepID=UPI00311A2156
MLRVAASCESTRESRRIDAQNHFGNERICPTLLVETAPHEPVVIGFRRGRGRASAGQWRGGSGPSSPSDWLLRRGEGRGAVPPEEDGGAAAWTVRCHFEAGKPCAVKGDPAPPLHVPQTSAAVPGTFDNAAARKGKDLEDRRKGLYKKAVKEKYKSVTTLGKDCPVPKSNPQTTEVLHVVDQQDFEERAIPGCRGTAITSKSRSHAEASENTEPRGSFSGGSRDPAGQISGKGVTPESLWRSATDPANPSRGRRGHSSLEERETNECKEVLFYQQACAGEGLYLCTECQKTFKLKIGLLRHKQIHTKKSQEPSYICTECGNSFGRYADLVRHQQAHTGQRPYKCTECEKSFMEKPRLTNHLRTHNIYM